MVPSVRKRNSLLNRAGPYEAPAPDLTQHWLHGACINGCLHVPKDLKIQMTFDLSVFVCQQALSPVRQTRDGDERGRKLCLVVTWGAVLCTSVRLFSLSPSTGDLVSNWAAFVAWPSPIKTAHFIPSLSLARWLSPFRFSHPPSPLPVELELRWACCSALC